LWQGGSAEDMAATKKELVLAAGILLTLPIAAELALRVSGMQFEPQLYAPSVERGWVLRAGVSGVVSTETPQKIRINSHGFRDRERSFEKPADTVRIAVLGNSWTEALQVPQERTYTAVLEKALNEGSCFDGKRVEVLNFGVAGYSTAQELLMLRQEVWKYSPDIILLAFYPARDIANNVRELNNAANPEQSPYYVNRGGRLEEDDRFRELPALQPRQIQLQRVRYEANDRVRLLAAISALQRQLRLKFAMATMKERAERAGAENLEYSIYAPPQTAPMAEGWRVTEGLLKLMRDEARSRGAEFRIVVLATRPQVLPDAAKSAELAVKVGVEDFTYADKRLRDFGAKESIRVTTLAPYLSSYAKEHHTYLNGFNKSNWGAGHWNETGHRLAAEAIAGDLCGADGSGAEVTQP